MNSKLIAPCGMNCALCLGYLREKNRCPGCREMNEGKPNSCRKCTIINCNILNENNWKFCSDKCEKYPCKRLKDLDKRYRAKYDFSMIDNLKFIEDKGIKSFIEKQKNKYIKGNKILCIHNKECYDLK